MGVELAMLVYSAVLAFVLLLIPSTQRVLQYGLAAGVGNRENPMPLPVWADRAFRAQTNLYESLPIFAIFVLVVHLMSAENAMTALGAKVFFWARVAHAAVYIAGIPWIRTLIWLVAVAGMVMVALPLFKM